LSTDRIDKTWFKLGRLVTEKNIFVLSKGQALPVPEQSFAFKNRGQRAILNFTPGPQGWTSPLRVNLAPRSEICP
jgi:hypothetical protein